MSQSLVQIYLHLVFSTKLRQGFLKDMTLRQGMHAYLAGICNQSKCPALIVGGVEDHVHILCRLAKMLCVADFIRELKRDSSKWIKCKDSTMKDFKWQEGYGAFSISASHVKTLETYIAQQEEHHHAEPYQDEMRRLCREYEITLDERYVWD